MDSIPSQPRTASGAPRRDPRDARPAVPAVGHYVLGRCIGSGGMARVYEARHRFLGHRVAIKLLYPEHCSDRHLVRRFCNEGRAAAAIEHPGVVRYFDIGRTPAGDVYLVTELLVGESLHRRLLRGPLTEAAAVSIGRQVASALAAAHAHGLVHRDVKPENVFLVLDPEVPGGERVKVLDFGVAKRTLRADTSPGVVVGTPAYMAPEQCQSGMVVDGRADVYALGALLHRMVTGQPLFESASDVGLMCRQVHDAPPTPRALGVRVSDAFERMLATCLAKNPADRFPSMAALADTLAALAVGAGPRIVVVRDTALTAAQVVPGLDPNVAEDVAEDVAQDVAEDVDGGFDDDITVAVAAGPMHAPGPAADSDGYIALDVDADVDFVSAPMYPVYDLSPPGGTMADGTPPPRRWTQGQAGGLAGKLRAWGSLGKRRASPAHGHHLRPRAVTSLRPRGQRWIALGSVGLGMLMLALTALFL